MKPIVVTFVIAAFLYSCSDNAGSKSNSGSNDATTEKSAASDEISKYDPQRGEGKFTKVELGPLDASMAEKGKSIYDVKCSSCHKLTDEKLVGPGWSGVTKRFTAEWIMNFITNPDAMIDKDPELQKQLELCLVRMPNQNLADEDARNVLEFMRKNDGAK